MKMENLNTQNDYETEWADKKWTDKKKSDLSLCFENVLKFQENKFKIVQKNFQEIKVKLIKRRFLGKTNNQGGGGEGKK